jgi:hypothetical protein
MPRRSTSRPRNGADAPAVSPKQATTTPAAGYESVACLAVSRTPSGAAPNAMQAAVSA